MLDALVRVVFALKNERQKYLSVYLEKKLIKILYI